MKKNNFLPIFLLIIAIFAVTASAHVEEGVAGHEVPHTLEPVDYLLFDPFIIALYVFALALFISAVSIFFQNRLTEKIKKIFFIVLAVSVGLTTIYAALSTVYLNVVSQSGGPVHWHADFEIWECENQISNLKTAEFPSNKVGSAVLHHHDDFRIHVEGLVIKFEDVSLKSFFGTIGGHFTGDSLAVVLEDGSLKTVANGQTCSNGEAGKWRLYLKNHSTGEFEESTELENHVIKPFFDVPPGDYFLLVFDSKEGVPLGR